MRSVRAMLALPAVAAALASSLAAPLAAQAKERVQFALGNDTAAIEASVTEGAYRDYVLGARAGQAMGVSLITEGSAFFNVLPPGSDDVAIHNGSTGDGNASIPLPEGGDYTIRVYLMGNDRNSGQTVPLTLSMTIM